MLKNKKDLNNQMIYQVFVRQFSPSHDFNGVTAQLDRIKALGTDILYLMPFYPIGKKGRKGSVGSPYSIYDYTAIDPMNGTLDDFLRLLDGAHRRGIKVIIDMVLNHTSRDSVLLQQHEQWFYHLDGKVGNRVGDWSDVCDLDYSNPELCAAITDVLLYWVKLGVDGFRMDVCSLVPSHFWAQAVDALHKVNPQLLMLGESVDLGFVIYLRGLGYDIMSDGEAYRYFDMLYSYDIGQSQGAFCERKADGSLRQWLTDVSLQEGRYTADYVKARYLDNHDRERIAAFWSGDALKALWALNFYLKGIAFVYAGDEVCASKHNSLFEIDETTWDVCAQKDISAYLARLAAIKKHAIYRDGHFELHSVGDSVAVCCYHSGNARSLGVFNLADLPQTVAVPLPDGEYIDLISDGKVRVADSKLTLGTGAVVVEIG